MRRVVAGIMMAVVGITLFACRDGVSVHAPNPVNIVLIVIDTLRPDYLSCYGAAEGTSPAIDALACDGVLFENVFCHSPITGPSHASLFTSLHPSDVGVVNNTSGLVPLNRPMMAEILHDAGYETGAAVAIAPVRAKWGFSRGFDYFEDRLSNTWILSAEKVMPFTLETAGKLDTPFFLWSHLADPHEPYDAHGLTEHSAEIILNGELRSSISTSTSRLNLIDIDLKRGENELVMRSGQPFQVMRLSMRKRGWKKPRIDPEHPSRGYFSEYRATITSWRNRSVRLVVQLSDRVDSHDEVRERYRREVHYVDEYVGRLISNLKQRGLYDDSLVIFTSDHGEGLGCHGRLGHVETLYDCLMRVPLIIKPPRATVGTAGERRDDLAGLVDVLPTVASVVGLEADQAWLGRDLFATNEGGPVFMETHRPQAKQNLFGLRGERYSIIVNADEKQWEFYDTTIDPDQEINLFDIEDPLVIEWQQRLQEILRSKATSVVPTDPQRTPDDATREMLRSLGYLQ